MLNAESSSVCQLAQDRGRIYLNLISLGDSISENKNAVMW